MDRLYRSVTRVSNYRQFHISGERSHRGPSASRLSDQIQNCYIIEPVKGHNTCLNTGESSVKQVSRLNKRAVSSQTIDYAFTPDKSSPIRRVASAPGSLSTGELRNSATHNTSMSEIEDLRKQLEELRNSNAKLEQEAERLCITTQLDQERRKQAEWETTLCNMKDRNTHEESARVDKMWQLHELMEQARSCDTKDPVSWLQDKLNSMTGRTTDHEREVRLRDKTEKLRMIAHQQQALASEAVDLVQDEETTPKIQQLLQQLRVNTRDMVTDKDHQENLMQQLCTTLNPGTGENTATQRELIKQFLCNSSKMPAQGGVNTLKPELLKRLLGESDDFSMAEWLARYNIQDTGECIKGHSDEDCKHGNKYKLGMLDKATTNIQQKQVWPQKKLLEDWADEEVEFRNMTFEHFVAGEMRTIEKATDPAEILGRLKLVRRLAYIKLRGFEWSMVRKIYAAILRSIKAEDNTWDSNFDRFESILHRRYPPRRTEDRQTPSQATGPTKKWYCRDWNKAEECTKNSPHRAWFGTGNNAVSRQVLHICAACYMKEKAQRDHPEGTEGCPYKEA